MGYTFTDSRGSFELKNAGANSYLYFPMCNEAGIMSSITPGLGGDLKLDQNRFILQPTSVEDLHNNRSSRNFWLKFADGVLRSASGASVWQRAELDGAESGITLNAGLLWQEVTNEVTHGTDRLTAKILSFVPADATTAEIMRVKVTNSGLNNVSFTPYAVIPMYGRSAANLRDHRHVTSLLHRISTERYGVRIRPTLSFDERGHLVNDTEYFTLGCDGRGNAPVGFLPSIGEVIGEGGDLERPLGLMQDRAAPAGETREGVEAVGGLKFAEAVLKPGESAEYIIFIGAKKDGDGFNSAEDIIGRFGSSEKTEAALEADKSFWLGKAMAGLGIAGAEELDRPGIPKEERDRRNYMLWVAAEPVLRRIFGCSFLPYHDYGKGGRGWRDLWQDCLALMLADPADVRDLLINNFAGVRADGTNATIIGTKPGEFIADRNGIARVWMDHGVWPWITVRLYIELSGDTALLDTEQVYFKDRLAKRARGTDDGFDESLGTQLRDAAGNVYRGSLLEHILLMHVTAACDVGSHGHMLLRGADWNDALDMAPEKGESVAFTAAYSGNLKEIAGTLDADRDYEILEELADLTEGLAAICRRELETGVSFNPEGASEKRGLLDSYCEKVKSGVSGRKKNLKGSELAALLNVIADSSAERIRRDELMTKDGYAWFNGYYDNEGLAVESLEDGRLMLTGAVFTIMSGIADEDTIRKMTAAADRYLFDKAAGGYRLNTRFPNEAAYAHKLGRMFGFAYGSKENGAVFCHMAVMYAYALLSRGFADEAQKVIDALIDESLDFDRARIYPGIPEYFDINGRGMYPYLTGAASWLLLYDYRRRK